MPKKIPEARPPIQPTACPLPPALRAALRRARAQPPPCLLCGAQARSLRVFVPTAPQVWGVAEGWQAGVVYTLCAPCGTDPHHLARSEAALWASRPAAVQADARRRRAGWN